MHVQPYNTIGGMGYKYNQDTEDFDMIRVIKIKDGEFTVRKVDNKNYHIIPDSEEIKLSKDEFSEYSFLEPDAVLTLVNVNMMTDTKGTLYRDIMIMMFAPDSNGVFEFTEPTLLARQLLDNPYNELEGVCGFSFSKDDLETLVGASIEDLLYSESIINKNMTCMYKTDNIDDIVTLLDNETTQEIFSDLFVHCADKDNDKGFCRNLKEFMTKYGALSDARLNLGISYIDMDLSGKTALDDEARYVLSTLYSINIIERSLITKFSYEADLDQIKMPYFLVYDVNEDLYIVAYTKFKNELLKAETKKLEENIDIVYKHIRAIAKNMTQI